MIKEMGERLQICANISESQYLSGPMGFLANQIGRSRDLQVTIREIGLLKEGQTIGL